MMSKHTAANRNKWMFGLFWFTALKKTFSAQQKISTVYEESKVAEWMRMSVRAFIPWLFATIASELSLGRMCSCFFLLWKQFDRSSWWRTEQWPAEKPPAALKIKLCLSTGYKHVKIKRRMKALVDVYKSVVFQQSSSLFRCWTWSKSIKREELPLFILSRRGNMVAILLEPQTAPTQEYVFLGQRGK